MARVVRFHETGGPEVLRVETLDAGEPGPGEALVRIEAIGLNRAEAARRGGHYIVKPPLPARLGAEATGVIVKLGPDSGDWAVGDAICTTPNGGLVQPGVYASEVVLPLAGMLRRPEGLAPEQAASVWVAFFTAWGGMVETGGLAKGEFVIIPAASSGVGLAAVQIASDLGAIPIAATRRSDKAQALRDAGAAHVVATEEQDLKAEVARITDGKGVRLIFDPVAGPFAETLFECLTDDGVLMIYGGMANLPATFPRQLAIRRNLTMRGYNFFTMLNDPARRAAAYDYIWARLKDGRFRMPVAKVFALEDVVEAHRYLESNQHVGKVVMRP
ncbi:MAG: zinc-dependent alcohol dehydrogenase family protein [Phenylobacterium sp.]|uniref:zinc-dependent alcohol dehydrogenase family protein n=1 Tax=Phenylobacterium sp. TaxID=1871053 RepID=UPI00273685FD|nr:zinc-dependent alcohol dehydrogenase family protein [Phenylobacterium sp.]MDP3175445.1 zinc-dependent alcohol dehydrogenase family protein [Phenylobacterium sp.]